MDLLFPYSESKLKPFLKMATQRITIANNKRATASTKHKREIAKLIEEGKAEKAIIRVEHVIRDDYTMEAYEIIEIMCDLLYERVRHLSRSEMCPPDLVEAVSTVLWASSRVDISELEGVKKQLKKKYGNEFCDLCVDNSRNTVNSRVMLKLNVAPPSNLLIRSFLKEIAREYNVEWDDESFPIKEDGHYKEGHQMGYSIPMAPSSGLGGVYMDPDSIPTPMTSLPPAYDDAQFHTTTEIGGQYHAPPVSKYQEEEMSPPPYGGVPPMQQQQAPSPPVFPPSPPYHPQQQPQQQTQHQPQHQTQQPEQSQQPTPSQQTQQTQPPPAPPDANAAPSYDDLMARFKNLKN